MSEAKADYVGAKTPIWRQQTQTITQFRSVPGCLSAAVSTMLA